MNSSENTPNHSCNDLIFGNDVVDLNDLDVVSRNNRILARIFTAGELKLIEENNFSKKIIWTLWACKEASFKALQGEFSDILFRWKSFEVQKSLQSVRYRDNELTIKIKDDENLIHAVASGHMECFHSVMNRSRKIFNSVFSREEIYEALIREMTETVPFLKNNESAEILKEKEYLAFEDMTEHFGNDSAAVRLHGMMEVKNKFKIPLEEILVSRVYSRPRVPVYIRKNGGFITRASFSHHGQYFAVAFPE